MNSSGKTNLKNLAPIFRYFHAGLQTLVIGFFYYQGLLGFRIRAHRKRGELAPGAMKTHRRNGPRLALLVTFGYFLGLFTTTYLSGERFFEHGPHFLNGSFLVLLVSTQYLVSKRIKGRKDSVWRNFHLGNGIFILFILLIQFALGLRLLLFHP